MVVSILKTLINKQTKSKEKAVERCIKYKKWGKLKQCKSVVFDEDEYERKWDYCIEHGCKICLGNARKEKKKKLEVVNFGFVMKIQIVYKQWEITQ